MAPKGLGIPVEVTFSSACMKKSPSPISSWHVIYIQLEMTQAGSHLPKTSKNAILKILFAFRAMCQAQPYDMNFK